MIEVLADALEPFSVMNEKLKEEWEAVINKLQIVWKLLKRIALEDFLLETTKMFQNLIDSIWTKTDGLTKKGRQLTVALRATFEIMRTITLSLLNNISQVGIVANSILNIFSNLSGLTGVVQDNFKSASSTLKGFMVLVEAILKGTWLISETINMILITIRAIIAPINYIIEAFKALGSYTAAWGMRLSSVFVINKKYREGLKKAADEQQKLASTGLSAANKELIDSGSALLNMLGDADKRYKDINASLENMIELLEKAAKTSAKLGQDYKITFPTGVFDEWFKMQGEFQRAEAAQYKGPKRWEIEAKQKIQALDDIRYKAKKNIQDLLVMEEDYRKGILKMNDKQYAELGIRLSGYKEVLGNTYKYEGYIKAEVLRKTLEFNKREEISNARKLRQYRQFLREALQVPLTPKEKVFDWVNKAKIDLKSLAVESKFFKENYEEVLAAIEKGGEIRMDKAIKDMNIEVEKFIAKASKATAWNNVFDNINVEFAGYIRQIEKSNKLDETNTSVI